MKIHCDISESDFDISSSEQTLRESFWVPSVTDMAPSVRMRNLWAFWPHWALHKRRCSYTHEEVISVFSSECPYPVWNREIWNRDARPPVAQCDFSRTFFDQAHELFTQCPIPHIVGLGNENCLYADDWWYGKNCYLCHSGVHSENSRYCYRIMSTRDTLFGAFTYGCEHSIDVINSEDCFSCVYGLYLKKCQDTFFSYDCRNCHHCLFCFNLRNKSYCIGNKQYTKEAYEEELHRRNFSSQSGYEKGKEFFRKMMREIAWHKSSYLDFTEHCSGNYIFRVKNMEDAYFGWDSEDCMHIARFGWAKTCLDSVNLQDCERVYMSSGIQVKCYDVSFCFQMDNVRFAKYSGYSSRCQNIFGCMGLIDARNCILNQSYSQQEYDILQTKVIDHMKSTEEWGQFFPGKFAPNTYDESWSGFHFPLSHDDQLRVWFSVAKREEMHQGSYQSPLSLPAPADASDEILKNIYWDDMSQKPFQILAQDVLISRDLWAPLPSTHYIRRLKENFSWVPFHGTMRTTTCAKSWALIQTSWPTEYDGRIVSEEEYNKMII